MVKIDTSNFIENNIILSSLIKLFSCQACVRMLPAEWNIWNPRTASIEIWQRGIVWFLIHTASKYQILECPGIWWKHKIFNILYYFPYCREEEEYIVSDGLKQIPIKWTAPEALNYGKYTSLCDVWSYGVLAWEIFSKGGTPYQGMTNTRARELIDSGYRMPAPDSTPDEMYQLMLR